MVNGELVVEKRGRVRKENKRTARVVEKDRFTEEQIVSIVKSINEYTDSVEIPIVQEWKFKNLTSFRNFDRARFELVQRGDYRIEEAFERLYAKKEYQLEYMSLYNLVNYKMAAYSLKQLGWTDKQEIKADVSSDVRIQVKFK